MLNQRAGCISCRLGSTILTALRNAPLPDSELAVILGLYSFVRVLSSGGATG